MTWQTRLKLAWVRFVDASAMTLLALLRRLLFRRLPLPKTQTAVRRILVFRIGNIGDTLIALPVFDAVRRRFPAAYVCLLTSPGPSGLPGAADILPRGHWFDDYIGYCLSDTDGWRDRLNLLRRLRSPRFDLFIDCNELVTLRSVVRNLIFARLSGCRYAAGFRLHHPPYFLRAQMLNSKPYRESQRVYSFVARELDLEPFHSVRLPVSEADRGSVRALLSSANISPQQSYVVMHIGAKRQTNRWPLERYIHVADEITVRYRLPVVLTGSPSELPIVKSAALRMREEPVVLCGDLTLSQMAALLEGSSLYVGNDTGPMHIAALVGTRTVSIFSARDFPGRWYPIGTGHIAFRRDAPCSPCFKEVCDRDLLCMQEIQPKDVLVAVEQQIHRYGLKQEIGRQCRSAG